ncbi:MAG: MFS transporter [Candidatus Eremiobacteraeota bacterium]|nr:MFS transporter [Candidatus Eremiobacteraeota bacterium]
MPARAANALRLALFWLGIQAVWGALLGISLQSRSLELAGGNALVAYGRLATAGALVAAITQVIVGFWSDSRRRAGSRRIEFYVAGAVVGCAGLALFYSARTLVGLTVALLLLQAALNVAIGPYQAIIPDFIEPARTGAASSWMAALQGAGNAIGALAASFIVNGRTLAATLSAMVIGTAAITVVHVRNLPLRETATPAVPAQRRAFVDLFISRALAYVGFYTLLGYLLFYIGGVLGNGDPTTVKRATGIVIVAFTLLGAVGAGVAAHPSDRLDKRLVATLGGAAFVVALGLFIGSSTLGAIGVATAVAGLGWGVFLVADWAIACRVLPQNAMAAAMGIWNLAIVGPQIVAPALTTLVLVQLKLANQPGAPRVAFGLALIETSLGIAWLWRLSRCVIR